MKQEKHSNENKLMDGEPDGVILDLHSFENPTQHGGGFKSPTAWPLVSAQ